MNMRNYFEDFNKLRNAIKVQQGCDIINICFGENGKEEPTFHDGKLHCVWFEDCETLAYTIEKHGLGFVHEVDLISLVSLVSGNDVSTDDLDYIFNCMKTHCLGENFNLDE